MVKSEFSKRHHMFHQKVPAPPSRVSCVFLKTRRYIELLACRVPVIIIKGAFLDFGLNFLEA